MGQGEGREDEMLKVNTEAMQNQYEELGQLVQRLNEAAQEVNAVSQRLSWDVAVSKRVRQVLGQQNQHLSLLSDHAEQLRQVLLEAIRQYERTEQANAGKGNGGSTSGGGSGGGGGGAWGSEDGGSRGESENARDWKKALDEIKKYVDALAKILKDSGIGGFGSVLGMYTALLGLSDQSNSGPELTSNLFKLLKSATELEKWREKFQKNTLAENQLGVLAGIWGILQQGSKLYGKSLQDFLRESGDYISSGGSFGTALYKFVGKEKITTWEGLKTVAPLSALGTMLTRFTGDVMMYSKDGVYDIVDYGKTLLDSGLTGGRSLLKALTLGIVDINVDQANAIFEQNTDKAKEYINNMNLPTWAKTAMVLPGSAGVTVYSGVEVFLETGKDSVEKVMNGYRAASQYLGKVNGYMANQMKSAVARWKN